MLTYNTEIRTADANESWCIVGTPT